MAQVVKANEKIILTAEENAVLRKSLNILEDIYKDCEDTNGDAFIYTRDAIEDLEFFLDELSENGILTVEEPKNDNCCVFIKLEV